MLVERPNTTLLCKIKKVSLKFALDLTVGLALCLIVMGR